MAEVIPFKGVHYDERVAGPLGDLVCPPYDVISEAERERLLSRSPYNFVRTEFPSDDPAEPADLGRRYARAAEALRDWLARGVLRADATPALYLQEHEFTLGGARKVRRGFFCALRLYDEGEGVVLPHERTFPKAKADRLELLRATRTNTSAVFGMFAGDRDLLVELWREAVPAGEATVNGERHALRRLDDPRAAARLTSALADQRIYIADGHHRYETALAYLAERGAVGERAPERYTLAYLCPLEDPGLQILATHRIVRGADGALDAALSRSFTSAQIDRGALDDVQPGIVLARGGRFLALEPRTELDRSGLPAAWRTLPVAVAEEFLLRPAREAGAEVAYEHDTDRAIQETARGATAVLLRAVDPETLRRVADAGERLPQKTTYFYPKAPAGLVLRSLDV